MALSLKGIELLKDQGLEADIRNKLGCAKMIPWLFKLYLKEKDPIKKEKTFNLLNTEVERLEESVDHICDSFKFFEIKIKKEEE